MEGREREGTQGIDAPGVARVLGFAVARGAQRRNEAARAEAKQKEGLNQGAGLRSLFLPRLQDVLDLILCQIKLLG